MKEHRQQQSFKLKVRKIYRHRIRVKHFARLQSTVDWINVFIEEWITTD